ncbi:hypothetical protein G9A89_017469 [Geosiphon pyriformis]|nr:hypothetical protein G9A89_017469 [Geosiphon pyriformis]
MQAISYFLQDTANSCINQLANTFTTIKQGENKAVTTYLECFHRNLRQIQAIQADYFTVPQILNQFIRGLHSSILQCMYPIYLTNLQAAITNARDFEATELEANHAQTPQSQNYLSLLVTPEDIPSNHPEPNQKQLLTNNIPSATISNNKSLAAIFPFKLEETTPVSLFNGAALNTKPITAMYTDAKVDGHAIKLILDSRSASSIIIKQLMDQLSCQVNYTTSTRIITANGAIKTSIGEINDFSFEINGIIIFIKVLVMEATQYQALIGNDSLSKTNVILDWTMQKLQLSQNGQHTCVPVTCGHFKTTNSTTPLIEFEEKEKKPI